jgi:hypothetical protein
MASKQAAAALSLAAIERHLWLAAAQLAGFPLIWMALLGERHPDLT